MKKRQKRFKLNRVLPILFALFCLNNVVAQTPVTTAVDEAVNQNAFTLSPRIGFDFPFFQNNTPHIDYKGGLDLGISADYYWTWFGVGADFDYLRNKPKSNFDFSNVYGSSGLITSSTLIEDNITRMFYGIGPDFKWQNKSGKFTAELNTRIGLGGIKGGRVLEVGNAPGNDTLNFHAGYDFQNKLASKLQTKFTYYFNQSIGVNAGMYYIQHYYGKELTENGISAAFQKTMDIQSDSKEFDGPLSTRTDPCNCNIFSLGVFAGVTFKIPTKPKEKKPVVEEVVKIEEECKVCDTYALAVTARDKFTKKILPNTDVVLKNSLGEIVETGTTNGFGVVVFDDVKPDNFTIDGLLEEIALDQTPIAKTEFVKNGTLQKEIVYSNADFILQGNAVVCNTAEGIPGVKVKLFNKAEGVQKSTTTDDAGKYILHVEQNKVYTISGQKDSYFSQVETVDTKDFDRNTTLFVKIEICMEKVDCGKALALKNIHYDLDKFFIREDAKPELNRLVDFMKDNPTLKVEVSSHTDSRSSDAYNQKLSQNRANAAVDYIVSQGISRARLTGKGYGESRLLNECADGVECSKEQHQINRRTEMKVICPD